MTRWIFALVLVAGPAAAAQTRPIPEVVADRISSVQSAVAGDGPMWSADGRALLYLSSLGGSALWSAPIGGGVPERVAGDVPSGLVRLSPDGARLAYLSDKSGNPEIWLTDLGRGPARRLTDLGARINAMSWSPDGRRLAISALRFGQFDLFVVDAASGEATQLTSDPRYETYPAWSPDGRTIYYIRSDDRWADHEVMAIGSNGGQARMVAGDRDLFDYGTIGTRARFGYPLVSPDGRTILFRSHRSGWVNYWLVPSLGGDPRPLAAEPADQSDAAWAPDGRSVAFVSNRNGTTDLRVAAVGGAVRVVVPLQTGVASGPTWAADGQSIGFFRADLVGPNDLYVVAAAGGSPRRLTVSVPADVERQLIVPEKVSYQSDEFTIPAYLYRPLGVRPGQRVPAVLYIHGGPTGQFSDQWHPQPQFLARMGYLVLAPNIRGSSGYGKAFEDANNPCWTRCDLRDVLAAVEWLKARPDVDAENLGITGISYGGIMSMGAVARAPGIFRAAVPQSGYADWISFQDYNAELGHSKLLAYEWGPYPDSAAVYRSNSSIFLADQVTTPTFVLHGEGASQPWRPGVLPIPSSLEFVHALERRNKVVRYKTYPGETYYVYGRANSRQVLLDMLDWFDRYLRATPLGDR